MELKPWNRQGSKDKNLEFIKRGDRKTETAQPLKDVPFYNWLEQ